MKEELISVIIPIYKVEKYLKKCVDSIIDQSYTNLEIILVDDGSPDDCGKICDQYAEKDSRIKVIHKENGGVSQARNIGIDNTNGKYVVFIDADDYIKNNYIQKLYEQCVFYKSDIGICGKYLVQEDGTIVDKSKSIKKVMNKEEALKELLDEKYIFTTLWDKMYKKEVLKKCKFDENKKIGEDFDYLYQAILNSDTISINTEDILYYYVKREGSAMNSRFDINEWKNEIKLCEKIIDDTKKYFPAIYEFAIKRYTRISIDTINKAISENDNITIKEIRNDIKKYKNNIYNKWNFKSKLKIFIIFNFTKIWRIYINIKSRGKI